MTKPRPHAVMAKPQTAPPRREQLAAAFRTARAHHQAGRLDAAERGYRAILAAAPGHPDTLMQLGRIALARGDARGALSLIEAALKARPDAPPLLLAKAQALGEAGQGPDALALYDRLIRLAPKEVRPRADKALLLQRMGDFDAAEAELRRALKRAPGDGALMRMIAVSRKLKRGEPLISEMKTALRDPATKPDSRMQLNFALAKAMADTGERDRVFRHLDAANAAVRAARPFDRDARMAEVDGLIAAFEGADFAPLPAQPDAPVPIFVTGLPRSGTTLVEQILAAHSRVTPAGERRTLLEEAYRTLGTPGRFTPLRDLPDAALTDFAARYLAAMERAIGPAPVFTDKSIQTHLVLGLVAKALPQAKLLVVRRDPRDLGFSIYRHLFAPGTHAYAYDQEDIAAYIASFERMIAFWRQAIPGRFTEVTYEALVAAPEAGTRALLDAAGLPWEDACLRFHERDGQVRTLSIQQVRQPMHTGASGGWRAYAAELAPMIAALERHGVALP
ncbi:MAG: tetratricopeptide repeat protein [Paracoccaceae bacterium]|jgi:tetratricopeptide (TPR) repeat protein|nr:tetratricopeptide repeat protein [Paracoccaceae bacterium]